MTCRGYDPKAVKVSKSVKRVAATITDNQQRRSHIRGYVVAEVANARASSRNRSSRSD
jgi:hypothetical protein